MADVNDRVREVLDDLIGSGVELGLQVAAYKDGALAVDAWAGLADEASGKPVDGDTLFTVFSTTKGIVATAMHLLAERGLIEYDDPIAKHWPEFGRKGKEHATIRHALTHQAGVPQMPDGVTPAQMSDWDWMCAAIANLEPLWEPGTRTGYHAYTFGWILGEVLRRADGRPIAQFIREEISEPLGIADDLFLGITDAVEPRVATLKTGPRPADAPAPPPDALILRAIPPAVGTTAEVFNRDDVRRSCHPAAGGIMTARAIARHYAMLSNGGELDGARILPAERVRTGTELQTRDEDAAIGQPIRKALGWWQGGTLSAMGPRHTAFGHIGAGGAIGFADPEYGFSFALTKNMLVGAAAPGESAAYRVAERVRRELGIPGEND